MYILIGRSLSASVQFQVLQVQVGYARRTKRWGFVYTISVILSSNYRCRGRWKHDCVVERSWRSNEPALLGEGVYSSILIRRTFTLGFVSTNSLGDVKEKNVHIGCIHWSVAHCTNTNISHMRVVYNVFHLCPCNAPALFIVFTMCGWASAHVSICVGGEFTYRGEKGPFKVYMFGS